jgi:hypothetical protein
VAGLIKRHGSPKRGPLVDWGACGIDAVTEISAGFVVVDDRSFDECTFFADEGTGSDVVGAGTDVCGRRDVLVDRLQS